MAAGDTSLGTGSTLTFAGVTADLLSLSLGDMTRDTVEVPHMGTIGARPKLFGNTYGAGTITAELHFDASQTPDTPMKADAGSLAIALGDGSTWTWATGSGMTGFEWNDPFEDVMTATATFEVSIAVSIGP